MRGHRIMRGTAVGFDRTLRAVDNERASRWVIGILTVLSLLGGWCAWFIWGQVSVYEVTDRAALEAEAAAHPVATRVDGRVVKSILELGRIVKTGELLVELDADTERLALEETKARLAGLREQIRSIHPEIQADKQGLDAHRKSNVLAIEQAKSRIVEAQVHSQFADRRAESRRSLIDRHLVSEEDYRQAQSEAEASHSTIKALQLNSAGLERDGVVQSMDREAKIANLERTLADLQGQVVTQESTVRRLEHDIALRQITAPTSGYLGRVEQLRAGSVVHTGDVLGTVVPVGKPHAVAFFPVSRAGKLRPGQRAQLRLDAFPWTQYGALQATVASVGNDPLDSRVRVELSLHAESTPTIPLAHGLSGTAEVEVEHASPAELLVRALGRKLTTTSSGRMVNTVPNNSP